MLGGIGISLLVESAGELMLSGLMEVLGSGLGLGLLVEGVGEWFWENGVGERPGVWVIGVGGLSGWLNRGWVDCVHDIMSAVYSDRLSC